MNNEKWKLIMRLSDRHAVLNNPDSPTPYVLACGYEEDNSWGQGRYCLTFETALALYLREIGNDLVKTEEQVELEQNRGMTYDRILEIAEQSILYSKESAVEYLDLNDGEKDYFYIKRGQRNEKIQTFSIKQGKNQKGNTKG